MRSRMMLQQKSFQNHLKRSIEVKKSNHQNFTSLSKTASRQIKPKQLTVQNKNHSKLHFNRFNQRKKSFLFQHSIQNNSKRLYNHNSISYEQTKTKTLSLKKQSKCTLQQAKQQLKNQNFQCALRLINKSLQKQSSREQRLYLKGLCLFRLKKYDKAYLQFTKLANKSIINKNIYLLGAISANRINKVTQALKIIKKGQIFFPECKQLKLYKAKLLISLKQYEKALHFYKELGQSECNKDSVIIYSGISQCYQCLNQHRNAIHFYKKILQISPQHKVRQKLIYLLLQLDQIKQAQDEYRMYVKIRNKQNNYLKGKIFYTKQNYKNAIIDLQISLSKETGKLLLSTLELLLKIYIQTNDIYSAAFLLQRSQQYEIQLQQIKSFHYFVQGAMNLRKKKIEQAQQCFKMVSFDDNKLVQVFYRYNGYCCFCNKKYAQAYQIYSKIKNKQKAQNYNQALSQIMIYIQKEQFINALKHLKYAENILGFQKIQIYLLKVYIQLKQKKSYIEKLQAKQLLYQALQKFPQDSILLFHLTVVNFYEQNSEEAFFFLYKAIQNSQTNKGIYFYLRSLIYAYFNINRYQNQYEKAISQLTIAISLDSQLNKKVFIDLAKCYYLLDDKQKSDQLLENLFKQINRLTVSQQLQLADVFFYAEQIDKAVSIYSKLLMSQYKESILVKLGQCRIVEGNFQQASFIFKQIKNGFIYQRTMCQIYDILVNKKNYKQIQQKLKRIYPQNSQILKKSDYFFVALLNSIFKQDFRQGLQYIDICSNQIKQQLHKQQLTNTKHIYQLCLEWIRIICYIGLTQFKNAYVCALANINARFVGTTKDDLVAFQEAIFDIMKGKDQKKVLQIDPFNIPSVKGTKALIIRQKQYQFVGIFYQKFKLPIIHSQIQPPAIQQRFRIQLQEWIKVIICNQLQNLSIIGQPPWISKNKKGYIFSQQNYLQMVQSNKTITFQN